MSNILTTSLFWFLAALITLLPISAKAVCDCGTPPCTGQTITYVSLNRDADSNRDLGASSCDGCSDPDGVSTWTLNFSCDGGDCECGRYITGDFWIKDPNCSSSTTANSVRFTSESPSDRDCNGVACNGMAKNPAFNQANTAPYDARAYSSYSGNIVIAGGYDANVDQPSFGAASFVKLISTDPANAVCTGGSNL